MSRNKLAGIIVACAVVTVVGIVLLVFKPWQGPAYNPEVAWSTTFGSSRDERNGSVRQTSDGGYVIAGYTGSAGTGDYDVWLTKTDSLGNKIWNRTFGGSDNDRGYSVQQTSDGGYIVTGSTRPYGVRHDVWLIKTGSSGDLSWNQTFGRSYNDYGHSVQQTSDGGYIIVGDTWSYGVGRREVWLIKTDSVGNEIWNKTFGGSNDDSAYSVQQTSDGGYIVTGSTESYGAGRDDVWLIKTDSSGNEEWNKTFGGSHSDYGRSVQQTSDGGYIVAGSTSSYGAGKCDLWLIKVSAPPEP
jgi:hypothetical protein